MTAGNAIPYCPLLMDVARSRDDEVHEGEGAKGTHLLQAESLSSSSPYPCDIGNACVPM